MGLHMLFELLLMLLCVLLIVTLIILICIHIIAIQTVPFRLLLELGDSDLDLYLP
jgi:hypothetical protein